jgi:hypothetical protein
MRAGQLMERACNGSTEYKLAAFPGLRSFAMEIERVTGAFEHGAKDSHMNNADDVRTNTMFGATDIGGLLW